MAPKCKKCLAVITASRNNPGITCDGTCNESYHLLCAKIPETLLEHIKTKSAAWICSACKISKRRSIMDVVDGSASDKVIDSSAGLPEILRVLNDLRDKVINIENSQQFLSDSIDEFKQQINMVLQDNKVLKKNVLQLEEKLSQHEYKLNKFEALLDKNKQDSIINDVVVTGLPFNIELKDDIVSSLLRFLDVKVQENDIKSVNFIKPKEHQLSSSAKPKLIIQTANIEVKNTILFNYRNKTKNRNYIATSDLGIHWPTPHNVQNIHIMNHLSPLQTKLYAEAKKIKDKFKLKYLWCKDGRILLRRDSDSNVFHVDSFNDINYIERSFRVQAEPTGEEDSDQVVITQG